MDASDREQYQVCARSFDYFLNLKVNMHFFVLNIQSGEISGNFSSSMLPWSADLSHWTSSWGRGQAGTRSMPGTSEDRLGVAISVYFRKKKALHTPHLSGEGEETAALASWSLMKAGDWFRLSCLMACQLLLAAPLADLDWLNLEKLHIACSDSWFSSGSG